MNTKEMTPETIELINGLTSAPNSQVAQKAEYVIADVMLPTFIDRIRRDQHEKSCRAQIMTCIKTYTYSIDEPDPILGIHETIDFAPLADFNDTITE